jgi:cytochrome c oxidase accessory protein FixG
MSTPSKPERPRAASLYESAKKIYPREIKGRFERLSKLATNVLLGLFYVIPWLMWDERQAILFDLPARKFYLLELTLWPQDFIYLAWLLMMAAFSLFFFTALAGRLWCGFACPQTVWTEAFIWMEQWTEGTRSQRMKLDKAPWSWNKLRRKGSKQFLWITFSMWTGFTFVGYFMPIRQLGVDILDLNVAGWTLFWGLFYGFATYGNAGYMREQVCKYMCPYARFQSAMFDKDTLVISYDESRGEPRGGRKRSVDRKQEGLGDCIDCRLCVQVCPTGIDIRDGLQIECIACAACIDACDSIMDKMEYPRGLVRYTTEHSMQGEKTHVMRPSRNTLYRELPGDVIENTYTIKVINQSNAQRSFRLSVDGVAGLTLDGVADQIVVAGGDVLSLPVRARTARNNAYGIMNITFSISAVDDESVSVTEDSRFLAPTP